MKFLTTLAVLTLSLSAFAHDFMDLHKMEQLHCRNNDGTNASAATLFLDDSVYDPASGLRHPSAANIFFNYSGSQNMTCVGRVKNDNVRVNCVGYYWDNEIAEVKFRGQGKNITAEFVTSEVYGNKLVKFNCEFRNQK